MRLKCTYTCMSYFPVEPQIKSQRPSHHCHHVSLAQPHRTLISSPVRKYRKSYCSHPGVGVGVSFGVGVSVGVGVAQNVKVFG